MTIQYLPYTYTYTDSTQTYTHSDFISMIEEITHWEDCLDQPKIRKPYLPNQIKNIRQFI